MWVCADCKIRMLPEIMISYHFGFVIVFHLISQPFLFLSPIRCFPPSCPSSTCQLSVGGLLTALCPPLSPTARRGILNVQVWPNLSLAVRCCVSAVMSILSSLCCSLYLGMHFTTSLYFFHFSSSCQI